ncbi:MULTISPECIES: hydroxymethylglutaryl-CoA lyase [unclassified Caballeronia]|jgi:hydroxymethylglutaryl-CoA lyase|uniref:hydroxymethylglutaryl-CoA lyase n=1 Tax=unclassified Caballeronia TaxID=2646786 RepID=UPI001FD4EA23|nr:MULTISPECIES: hydroxymethylglutaryl-CoA lyase [unclassified Caballeronia]MDR5774139.1 hydroxymethylglutaryl-CoA lyase [Caballeronia sp. LZ002]MDR5849574.1 hydroxymethylglutaryl-CoA lyase [Caballeronia sp. LZ003]
MKDVAVQIREVGLRDGLQMVRTILGAAQKLEWCARMVDAGVTDIEVTSFVPPKIVPQFADAVEVATGALAIDGLHAAALVPNLKGAQRAFDVGLNKVHYVLSASNEHNLKNVRRSTAESVEDFVRIAAARDELGRRVVLGAGVATAFGCTIAGEVDEGIVLGLVETLIEAGAQEITIADTVGYANPAQVYALMRRVMELAGPLPVACHFHDTRGLGLANVMAALDAGVRAFDSSLGGLGGCPFAPNATGNINTEDTVFMLEAQGMTTGIDIDKLLAIRETIAAWLPGEPFTGAIARAGLPKTFVRAGEAVAA